MRLVRALSYFVDRRPWATASLVGLLVVSATVEAFGIGFLIPLIEQMDTGGNRDNASRISKLLESGYARIGLPFELWTIMTGGFLLFLIQAILKFLAETQTVRIANRFTAGVRAEIFNGLLMADIAYVQRRKGSTFVNSIINECNRFQGAYLHSIRLLTALITALVYLVIAIYLSWQLVLAALVLMGAVFVLVKQEFGRANKYGDDLTEANAALQGTAMEHLSGLRILKAFTLKNLSLTTFTSQAYELARVYYSMATSQARLDCIFQVGMIGGLLLTMFIGVTFLTMSIPVLLTFVFVLYRLHPRISSVNKAYHQLIFSVAGVENVTRLIADTDEPSIRSGISRLGKLETGIIFEQVDFNYDDETQVLKDLTFAINCSETTAVVGSSGVGKTTIVDLLMRFYDPTSGRILVEGKDLRELDLDSWRSVVALVSQDIFLFNDTIRNNIAVGNPNASQNEILGAAQQAYAHEFVRDLPKKYDTMIGDRGVRLSGGQRQRIALARAIIRSPEILILDEATSELDSTSEQFIQQAVEEIAIDGTVIAIAHRLSTVRKADKIVVLENGSVTEEGNHGELLGLNGRYAEFLGVQEADFRTED